MPVTARFDTRKQPDGDAQQAIEEALGVRRRRRRIRCPKCAYEPKKSDRWFCSKCGKGFWNTFDTRGVCPVCTYQWLWTACPQCHQWSLHEDWYEKDAPPERA